MEFIHQHKKLFTTLSILTLLLVVVFNIFYYIFVPIQSQGNPENFVPTPFLEGQSPPAPPAASTEIVSPFTLLALVIALIIVILIIVVIVALLKHSGTQKLKRDEQRRSDLKRIAQAFEAYKQQHGQYPLSTTYQPEYYTGVNLSNDWNYYGLPSKEHMVRYLPDWPVSDPSIDYMAKTQTNQYLYYPKENGQKFYLYAHLESPGKHEQTNYNQQDNLLLSWGAYNYRVESGQEQAGEVQDIPHPKHSRSNEGKTTTPAPTDTTEFSTPPGQVAATRPEPSSTPESSTSPAATSDQGQPSPMANQPLVEANMNPGPASDALEIETETVAQQYVPAPTAVPENEPVTPAPQPTTQAPDVLMPQSDNVIQPTPSVSPQPTPDAAPEAEALARQATPEPVLESVSEQFSEAPLPAEPHVPTPQPTATPPTGMASSEPTSLAQPTPEPEAAAPVNQVVAESQPNANTAVEPQLAPAEQPQAPSNTLPDPSRQQS